MKYLNYCWVILTSATINHTEQCIFPYCFGRSLKAQFLLTVFTNRTCKAEQGKDKGLAKRTSWGTGGGGGGAGRA